MARYLTLTQDAINSAFEKAIEELRKSVPKPGSFVPDAKVTISYPIDTIPNAGATLFISPKAWVKMSYLVMTYATEVQWEGFCRRLNLNEFILDDIIVGPHTVTAATVTSDQEEYEAWLDTLTDDQINSKKFHGHSHVNMGVTPSGTDMKYREDSVAVMPKAGFGDSYRIFMIVNKKLELEVQIYDIEHNILYEDSDVYIQIMLDADDFTNENDVYTFGGDAKSKITEKTYTSSYNNNYYGNYDHYSNCGTNKSTKTKKENTSKPAELPAKTSKSIGEKTEKLFANYPKRDELLAKMKIALGNIKPGDKITIMDKFDSWLSDRDLIEGCHPLSKHIMVYKFFSGRVDIEMENNDTIKSITPNPVVKCEKVAAGYKFYQRDGTHYIKTEEQLRNPETDKED